MKRYYFCKARTSLLKSVLVLFVMMAAVAAKAQDASTTYNFKSLPAIDSLLFAGDATNWTLVTEGTSKYFANATVLGTYHGEKDADADINDFRKYFFKLDIGGSESQSYLVWQVLYNRQRLPCFRHFPRRQKPAAFLHQPSWLMGRWRSLCH